LPSYDAVPDWKSLLSEALEKRKSIPEHANRKIFVRSTLAAGAVLIAAAVITILWKRSRRADQLDATK
jgi:hypothetical protein